MLFLTPNVYAATVQHIVTLLQIPPSPGKPYLMVYLSHIYLNESGEVTSIVFRNHAGAPPACLETMRGQPQHLLYFFIKCYQVDSTVYFSGHIRNSIKLSLSLEFKKN